MKKFTFIAVLVMIFSATKAQTYFKLLAKDTTTWQHFNCFIPVVYKGVNINSIAFDNPVAAIDTITINSSKYKKIYKLAGYSINYSGKTLIGYMREDTIAKKIYFRENTSSMEYLLYDFSLNVNDSILLTFPSNSSDNGYYRADSIIVKNEKCGPRKHFYIRKHVNNPQPSFYYIEYIESIGSTLHALYLYETWSMNAGCQFSWMGNTCSHKWGLGLACKQNNYIKQYQSCTFMLAQMNACLNPVDSCNYRNYCSGLRSNSLPGNISVFPNPAKDHVIIKFKDEELHSLTAEISDLTGKTILTQKEVRILKEIKINFNKIDKGFYILKINVDDKSYSSPFLVED